MFVQKLACTVIALSLLSQPALRGETARYANLPASVQVELEGIANDFMVAWQKQDMATISNILAPDFLFAGPHGFKTKTATLTVLSHCTLGKFTLEDFQMRQTSPDSAILLYKIHRDLSCFGKKDMENTFNTDTFLRKEGKWSIVLTTEGELAPH